jgi:hypothetical protein
LSVGRGKPEVVGEGQTGAFDPNRTSGTPVTLNQSAGQGYQWPKPEGIGREMVETIRYGLPDLAGFGRYQRWL